VGGWELGCWMKLQCRPTNRRPPSERLRTARVTESQSLCASLKLMPDYLMTLPATSINAERTFAAEGFCALSYTRRWEIILSTH